MAVASNPSTWDAKEGESLCQLGLHFEFQDPVKAFLQNKQKQTRQMNRTNCHQPNSSQQKDRHSSCSGV